MARHEGKFGRKKEEAIIALLPDELRAGCPRRQYRPRTLVHWLQNPDMWDTFMAPEDKQSQRRQTRAGEGQILLDAVGESEVMST